MVCEACKGKILEMAEHHRVSRAQVDSVYYCLSHTHARHLRHTGTAARLHASRPGLR
jgi:hypothetical protein